MYEKQDGNGMSLDKLLSQAGFSEEEKQNLAGDDEAQTKSPDKAASDAEEAAGRLSKLPSIPSFLNPRFGGFRKTPRTASGGFASSGATADDQGSGFKVTVHVSPDGTTTPQSQAGAPYEPVTFFSQGQAQPTAWSDDLPFAPKPAPFADSTRNAVDPAAIPSTIPTAVGQEGQRNPRIPLGGASLAGGTAAALGAAGVAGAAGASAAPAYGGGSAAVTQSMPPVGSVPMGSGVQNAAATGPIGPLIPPTPAQWTYGVDMWGAPYAADVHGVTYPLDGNGQPYTYDAMGLPYTVDPYGMPQPVNSYSLTPTTAEAASAVAAMKNEMDDASRSHRKFRKLMIAAIIVLAVLATGVIGLVIATATGAVEIPGIGGASSHASSASSASSVASSSSSSSSASGSSSASSGGSAASSSDASAGGTGGEGGSSLAGDVQFYYSLTTAEGEHPTVHETVTFNEQGLCTKSVLRATFDSQAAASAFVTRVERDYGRAYLGGSVDGTTGTVEVNMTSSRLTRQEYENALRTTVQDLRVES